MKATLKLSAAYLLLLLLTGAANAGADIVTEVPGLPSWLPALLRGTANVLSTIAWIVLLVVLVRLLYIWGPRLWRWMSAPMDEGEQEEKQTTTEVVVSTDERALRLLERLSRTVDRLGSEESIETVSAIEVQVQQLVDAVRMLSERGTGARRRLGELQTLADAIRSSDQSLLARAVGATADRQIADLVRSVRATGVGGNMQPILLAVEELSGEAQRTSEEYDRLAAALVSQVVTLRRRLTVVQLGLDRAAVVRPLLLATQNLSAIEGDLSSLRLSGGQDLERAALPW